jgi:hypothetical protein
MHKAFDRCDQICSGPELDGSSLGTQHPPRLPAANILFIISPLEVFDTLRAFVIAGEPSYAIDLGHNKHARQPCTTKQSMSGTITNISDRAVETARGGTRGGNVPGT